MYLERPENPSADDMLDLDLKLGNGERLALMGDSGRHTSPKKAASNPEAPDSSSRQILATFASVAAAILEKIPIS